MHQHQGWNIKLKAQEDAIKVHAVFVIRDATASPTTPEGDTYEAALINCRYIANALWSTAQTLELLDAK